MNSKETSVLWLVVVVVMLVAVEACYHQVHWVVSMEVVQEAYRHLDQTCWNQVVTYCHQDLACHCHQMAEYSADWMV